MSLLLPLINLISINSKKKSLWSQTFEWVIYLFIVCFCDILTDVLSFQREPITLLLWVNIIINATCISMKWFYKYLCSDHEW